MIRKGTIDEAHQLMTSITEFTNPHPKEEYYRRLSGSQSLVLIAEDSNQSIGFKCGYERETGLFYSWMGGVIKAYRRKGVAEALLKGMERWCRIKGYKQLTFKTLNEHQSMLIFAIKHGFEIIDVAKSNKDPNLRIWLSKAL